jgi:hypothetical protein
MARTVPRTFQDFILVAAAVFVVNSLNGLMASQRKERIRLPRARESVEG